MIHKPYSGRVYTYQIKVEGRLAEGWSTWIGDMEVTIETDQDGTPVSIFTGPIPDQAALRGILSKIWDMNLTLISVIRNELLAVKRVDEG